MSNAESLSMFTINKKIYLAQHNEQKTYTCDTKKPRDNLWISVNLESNIINLLFKRTSKYESSKIKASGSLSGSGYNLIYLFT